MFPLTAATWPGRVPIQRHQPLDIQIQVSQAPIELPSVQPERSSKSKASHPHRDTSLDSLITSSAKNPETPAESCSASHSHCKCFAFMIMKKNKSSLAAWNLLLWTFNFY